MSRGLITIAATVTIFCLTTAVEADSYNCIMDPAQIIQLSANNSGVLSEVIVARGDTVSRGQAVARMVSTLEAATVDILEARARTTAQIAAQEARVAFVGTQLDRVRRLVEQNAQSTARLEELEYEYALAQSQLSQATNDRDTLLAEVSRARIALENTTVTSPIDGQVIDILLHAGEYAGSDRHIMLVAQLDPLHVDAYLPIDVFPSIKSGMTVTIRPDAPIGGEHIALISSVDSVFDAASKTFGVRVTLDNPDTSIPAGHRCQLEVNFSG